MKEWLTELCGQTFMPHGQCYLWTPTLVWLHAVSDGLIGLAYFSIPVGLFYLVRKRGDLPFPAIILMFGAFIVACGTTHLLEVWTIWHDDYYLTGAVKAATALISLGTAVALFKVVPRALQMTGPEQLRRRNESLEERVRARTAELEKINDRLRQEAGHRARLAAIVASSDDAVVGSTLEGAVTDWNDAAERIFGYRAEEIVGKPLGLLLPPDRLDEEESRLAGIVVGAAPRPIETQRVRKDGSVVDVSLMISPIRDADGVIVGYSKVARDITERKRMERERAEFERKLQETQKRESLGVLAGGVAHDFNNLLTSILGNASLAAMSLPPRSPAEPFLRDIEKGAARAADLCTQMLAYASKGNFVARPVDLNRLIEESKGLLAALAGRTATLRLAPAPALPPVSGDPAQLKQVLINLVVNAAEAIGGGEGVVLLTTDVQTVDASVLARIDHPLEMTEGEHVVIEVHDSGRGIEPAIKARIFEPFFSTKFIGRGLGLAAVLGILRGHRGGVSVVSEPGKGTTFRLWLPCAPAGVAAPGFRPPSQ